MISDFFVIEDLKTVECDVSRVPCRMRPDWGFPAGFLMPVIWVMSCWRRSAVFARSSRGHKLLTRLLPAGANFGHLTYGCDCQISSW